MKQNLIRIKQALELMRAGSALVHMHGTPQTEWFIVPGGPVSDITAEKIRSHALVKGQADGLFPKLDQTWRMFK